MDEHGRYAACVEELAGFAFADHDLPEYFELGLEVGDGGWSARVGPAADWLAEFWQDGTGFNPLSLCRAPQQLRRGGREGQECGGAFVRMPIDRGTCPSALWQERLRPAGERLLAVFGGPTTKGGC